MPGLLAKKIGMTQFFKEDGSCIPVTVLLAGPCTIVAKKTSQSDGYGAIQVGFGSIRTKNVNKAILGQFVKNNFKPQRTLKEFRTNKVDAFEPGDVLTVEQFSEGEKIDVTGISKGKGFQGAMKRWGFGGQNASHGVSISHRAIGSTGQNTYPGRVFKNKKMPGRMGGKQITVKNLEIIKIEKEQNIILIKGALPGSGASTLILRAKDENFIKRFEETKKAKAPKEKVEEN